MKTRSETKKMVERVRKIRDQLSKEIMNMSVEEENAYILKHLKELKAKQVDDR